MKKMMIILEIPDDEIFTDDVTPRLSNCRTKLGGKGNDIFCSTPVKVIDCPEEVISIIESKNINWRVSK